MRKLFYLLFVLVLEFGCTATTNVSGLIDIGQIKFVIHPYILYKNDGFYLVYQIAKDEKASNVRLQIGEKRTNDKFYYFFIGKSSFREYDHVVFRPVSKNRHDTKLFN